MISGWPHDINTASYSSSGIAPDPTLNQGGPDQNIYAARSRASRPPTVGAGERTTFPATTLSDGWVFVHQVVAWMTTPP